MQQHRVLSEIYICQDAQLRSTSKEPLDPMFQIIPLYFFCPLTKRIKEKEEEEEMQNKKNTKSKKNTLTN